MRTFYTCVAAFSTYDYAFKPEREEKFCKIHLETAVFLLWLRKLLAQVARGKEEGGAEKQEGQRNRRAGPA